MAALRIVDVDGDRPAPQSPVPRPKALRVPAGLFFFKRDTRKFKMLRYFFHIEGPGHGGGVGDDLYGTDFPTDASAFDCAQQIIRELKNAGGYDGPGLMMVVKLESGTTVFAIPFS